MIIGNLYLGYSVLTRDYYQHIVLFKFEKYHCTGILAYVYKHDTGDFRIISKTTQDISQFYEDGCEVYELTEDDIHNHILMETV